jgi:hypothetical protein
MNEPTPEPTRPVVPASPRIGVIVDTVEHGRQQVMDVLSLPFEEPMVFLRPERGGREWTVPLARFGAVLAKAVG